MCMVDGDDNDCFVAPVAVVVVAVAVAVVAVAVAGLARSAR